MEPSRSHPDEQDQRLQTQVVERTHELFRQADTRAGSPLIRLEVRFDLRGWAAGQARQRAGGPWVIRYNPLLLRENPEAFLTETVPHEVAHVIAFLRYGPRIRPHGAEWRAVMEGLGAAPERCHHYDLSRVPRRTHRTFPYHCGCGEHELTSIRHHRVLAGQTYLCRRCAGPLRPGRRTG